MLAPTLAPSIRHWLPGPARSIAAACPACGGLDSLVYSVGDGYICCEYCGWQRRLITAEHSWKAALAAATHPQLWSGLLVELTARAPDPLPPVAALLWRQIDATHWAGPSRTTPDTTYTVEYTGRRVKCDCPNLQGTCWHRKRSRELGCIDLTAASDLWPD